MLDFITSIPGHEAIISGIVLLIINLLVTFLTRSSSKNKLAEIKALQDINTNNNPKIQEIITSLINHYIFTRSIADAIKNIVGYLSFVSFTIFLGIIALMGFRFFQVNEPNGFFSSFYNITHVTLLAVFLPMFVYMGLIFAAQFLVSSFSKNKQIPDWLKFPETSRSSMTQVWNYITVYIAVIVFNLVAYIFDAYGKIYDFISQNTFYADLFQNTSFTSLIYIILIILFIIISIIILIGVAITARDEENDVQD